MRTRTNLFRQSEYSGGSPTYERPRDWLALPYPERGTQALHFLVAVFDGISNRIAFSAAGAYTVDWGDGSAAEDIASGTTAEHEYLYSELPDTSYCVRGYRQALVQVTPQAGQNLTAFDFQKKHTNGPTGYEARNILDVNARLPNCTTFNLGGVVGTEYRLSLLERFWVYGTWSVTVYSSLFASSQRVLSYSLPTTGVTAINYMLSGVERHYSAVSYASSTNAQSMFQSARAAVVSATLPEATNASYFCFSSAFVKKLYIHAPKATTIQSICESCRNLKSITGNLSAATTTTDAFKNCSTLETFLVTGMKASFNLATTNLNAAAFAAAGALMADGTGQTVTISSALDATLSAEQRAVWTDKNWTIAAV